jgi:hypothetical protein
MITVVGKGPSLVGHNFGSLIDSCSVVIRTAGGQLDNDYGHRTDYVIVTTLSIPEIKQSDLTGVKEIWIYPTKNRLGFNDYIGYIKEFFDGSIRFTDVSEWTNTYAKEAQPMFSPRVNYPSKGTVAVWEALKSLPYMRVNVVGFDYVCGRMKVPWAKHDFPLEKKLIYKAAEHYNKKVRIV